MTYEVLKVRDHQYWSINRSNPEKDGGALRQGWVGGGLSGSPALRRVS